MKRLTRTGPRITSNVSGESRVKQSFGVEVDINTIMKKYAQTGVFPFANQRQPRWGDFSNAEDYRSSLNRVIEAQMLFEDLPAFIRSEFRNDPGELLAALENPESHARLKELGVLKDAEGSEGGSQLRQSESASGDHPSSENGSEAASAEKAVSPGSKSRAGEA